MRILLAPLVLAAGCNLVLGLDPVSGGGDAADSAIGGDDADTTDGAGDDAVELDAGPLGPWGAPHLVFAAPMLTTDEQDPALSPDGTELYFAHQPMPTGDQSIYRSLRVGNAWGPFALVVEVSSGAPDFYPRLSVDGKTLFLTSSRTGGAGRDDLWAATRSGPTAAWGSPVNLFGINTPSVEQTASPCSDPTRYVMTSDRQLADNYDLYEVVNGTATPIAIGASASAEAAPFVTPDCLTLYFTSFAQGSWDLYVAHRDAVDLPFTNAQIIDELSNPENDEIDPWVSADQRRMLFASGEGGVFDLMESLR